MIEGILPAMLQVSGSQADDWGSCVQKICVRQLKAARELLGWSQADLVKASGVSIATIKLIELRGGELTGSPETRAKIMVCLERAGIDFPDNGLGVRLMPHAKRTPRK